MATLQGDLKDLSVYIKDSLTKFPTFNQQGLAFHVLNRISIGVDSILNKIQKDIDDNAKLNEFVKQQLNLDLEEASSNVGDSGYPEQESKS